MGSIFSSDSPPAAASFATPDAKCSRPVGGAGLLLPDPRSPTGGVERTPIQAGAAAPARAAAQDGASALVDPRSPTAGILRTPIIIAVHPHTSTDLDDDATCSAPIIDPRSPTAGIARTPIETLKMHPTEHLEPASGQLPKYELDDAEDDDAEQMVQPSDPYTLAAAAATGSSDHSRDVASEVISSEPISIAGDLVSGLRKSSIKLSAGQAPAGAVRPSMLRGSMGVFTDDADAFVAASRTPVARSATAAVPLLQASSRPARPTLRTADVNSPRLILQQKQIQKAGLRKQAADARPPSAQQQLPAFRQTALDKENKLD